jgi:hypothetical protein
MPDTPAVSVLLKSRHNFYDRARFQRAKLRTDSSRGFALPHVINQFLSYSRFSVSLFSGMIIFTPRASAKRGASAGFRIPMFIACPVFWAMSFRSSMSTKTGTDPTIRPCGQVLWRKRSCAGRLYSRDTSAMFAIVVIVVTESQEGN